MQISILSPSSTHCRRRGALALAQQSRLKHAFREPSTTATARGRPAPLFLWLGGGDKAEKSSHSCHPVASRRGVVARRPSRPFRVAAMEAGRITRRLFPDRRVLLGGNRGGEMPPPPPPHPLAPPRHGGCVSDALVSRTLDSEWTPSRRVTVPEIRGWAGRWRSKELSPRLRETVPITGGGQAT